MSLAQSGDKHYLFGKTRSKEIKEKISKTKGTTIYLFSLDQELIQSFPSARATAKFFNCDDLQIMRYAKSRYIFREKYVLSLALLEPGFLPTQSPLRPGLKGTTIFVYSYDHQLLFTFISSRTVAKHSDCSNATILKYARSNEIFKGKYILSLEKLPPKL
jgi:hypothetical protein